MAFSAPKLPHWQPRATVLTEYGARRHGLSCKQASAAVGLTEQHELPDLTEGDCAQNHRGRARDLELDGFMRHEARLARGRCRRLPPETIDSGIGAMGLARRDRYDGIAAMGLARWDRYDGIGTMGLVGHVSEGGGGASARRLALVWSQGLCAPDAGVIARASIGLGGGGGDAAA